MDEFAASPRNDTIDRPDRQNFCAVSPAFLLCTVIVRAHQAKGLAVEGPLTEVQRSAHRSSVLRFRIPRRRREKKLWSRVQSDPRFRDNSRRIEKSAASR
jgi:hypothetical protein